MSRVCAACGSPAEKEFSPDVYQCSEPACDAALQAAQDRVAGLMSSHGLKDGHAILMDIYAHAYLRVAKERRGAT